MKRVYTADNVAMAWHVRNLLEQHDIAAIVRNDKLYSVAGEMPVHECLPEVWVEEKLNVRRAEQIIRKLAIPVPEEGEEWNCGNCDEVNAASFDLCWNCQYTNDAID